ncbi:MAG: hypothetical protein ACLRVU_09655 [Beduini sp.]|uniref:hypothetical protein n=1 Tax=Beduini sp. TaxID=1922300 RepID=UPI0039A09C3C
MNKDQKTLKQFKIFREIIAWVLAISFYGLIVGCVMFIWFGVIGLKILLTCVIFLIFFGFLYIPTDKAISDCEKQHHEI